MSSPSTQAGPRRHSIGIGRIGHSRSRVRSAITVVHPIANCTALSIGVYCRWGLASSASVAERRDFELDRRDSTPPVALHVLRDRRGCRAPSDRAGRMRNPPGSRYPRVSLIHPFSTTWPSQPAGCGPAPTAAKLPRHDGSALADALQHIVEPFLEPRAAPAPQAFGVASEPEPPIGVERHRDHRGVMGPVLEQRPPALQQVGELLRPVASAPGSQNHMVGALDPGDAVDLDEPETLHEPGQILLRRRTPESVPVEGQPPGGPVGQAQR